MEDKATKEKSSDELKQFGLAMSLLMTIISGVLFWEKASIGFYFTLAAGVFLFTAVLCPRLLWPGEALLVRVGLVMTNVILILTFYLAVTPVSIVARLMGKQFLELDFESAKDSYWIPVDPKGPAGRYCSPY